ncbi:hypothetical protein [Anaerovibrio sp. JC8]|uniref:hypothetical protein n=1 Tax=Anaerovibrio sp. JC8 TaxID=1240085 RepID=UPI000A11AE9E|nr:hypothetical protein [Anaerovibrio sp. JC8]
MGKGLKDFFMYSWFLFLIFMLFIAGFALFMLIFHDIPGMISSGFVGITAGFAIFGSMSFIVMLTGFIPVFRRCYYKFPWLYPFTIMLMMNLFIAALAEFILEQGFAVTGSPRYEITVFLMIVQVIVCRYIMCLYLKKHPVVYYKDDEQYY